MIFFEEKSIIISLDLKFVVPILPWMNNKLPLHTITTWIASAAYLLSLVRSYADSRASYSIHTAGNKNKFLLKLKNRTTGVYFFQYKQNSSISTYPYSPVADRSARAVSSSSCHQSRTGPLRGPAGSRRPCHPAHLRHKERDTTHKGTCA